MPCAHSLALLVCTPQEVTWKSKIKAQFPNPNEYSAFMGEFSTCTGIVTFGMMLLSRVIFKKFGWGEWQVSALSYVIIRVCLILSPCVLSLRIWVLLQSVSLHASCCCLSMCLFYHRSRTCGASGWGAEFDTAMQKWGEGLWGGKQGCTRWEQGAVVNKSTYGQWVHIHQHPCWL